ncbi:MAG TPA: triose-phosphate isomerase, partial [Nitrosospira sp.]
MRSKLVAGNWKMHGGTVQNRDLLAAILAGTEGLSETDVAVCVPYPYLPQAQSLLQGTHISWGAQNVSQHGKGAYTGEVSAAMLMDFSCRYAIVGHSERRALYGEDSHTVALKFKAARAAGLLPILCVGETLDQREAGITEQIVAEQLDA